MEEKKIKSQLIYFRIGQNWKENKYQKLISVVYFHFTDLRCNENKIDTFNINRRDCKGNQENEREAFSFWIRQFLNSNLIGISELSLNHF